MTRDIIELRFFHGGWVFRVITYSIRWNRQENYWAISFEKLGRDYLFNSGMTWKEMKTAKRQSREAKEAARLANQGEEQ